MSEKSIFNSLHAGYRKFSFFCCRLLTFQNYLFQKIISRNSSERQTVWTQIKTDASSVGTDMGLNCLQRSSEDNIS